MDPLIILGGLALLAWWRSSSPDVNVTLHGDSPIPGVNSYIPPEPSIGLPGAIDVSSFAPDYGSGYETFRTGLSLVNRGLQVGELTGFIGGAPAPGIGAELAIDLGSEVGTATLAESGAATGTMVAGGATLGMVVGWTGLSLTLPFVVDFLDRTFDFSGRYEKRRRRLERAGAAGDIYIAILRMLGDARDGTALVATMNAPIAGTTAGAILHELAVQNLSGTYAGEPTWWLPNPRLRYLPAFFGSLGIPRAMSIQHQRIGSVRELLEYTGYTDPKSDERWVGGNLYGAVLETIAEFTDPLVLAGGGQSHPVISDSEAWTRALPGIAPPLDENGYLAVYDALTLWLIRISTDGFLEWVYPSHVLAAPALTDDIEERLIAMYGWSHERLVRRQIAELLRRAGSIDTFGQLQRWLEDHEIETIAATVAARSDLSRDDQRSLVLPYINEARERFESQANDPWLVNP